MRFIADAWNVCSITLNDPWEYHEGVYFSLTQKCPTFHLNTYTCWCIRLPKESIVQLYTSNFILPLELIPWVTLEGDCISRFSAVSISTSILWGPGIITSRCNRCCKEIMKQNVLEIRLEYWRFCIASYIL